MFLIVNQRCEGASCADPALLRPRVVEATELLKEHQAATEHQAALPRGAAGAAVYNAAPGVVGAAAAAPAHANLSLSAEMLLSSPTRSPKPATQKNAPKPATQQKSSDFHGVPALPPFAAEVTAEVAAEVAVPVPAEAEGGDTGLTPCDSPSIVSRFRLITSTDTIVWSKCHNFRVLYERAPFLLKSDYSFGVKPTFVHPRPRLQVLFTHVSEVVRYLVLTGSSRAFV